MLSLETSVSELLSVGPISARRLKRLEIQTVKDLLWHAPTRYLDFSQMKNVASLREGETVTVEGEVAKISTRTAKGKRLQITTATLHCGSAALEALWFNQPYLKNVLKPSTKIRCAGKVSIEQGRPKMISPEWEKFHHSHPYIHTSRLVPVYPETKGVSSKWLRARIAPLIFSDLLETIPDPLPASIRQKYGLLPRATALRQIHFPSGLAASRAGLERLAFEEALHYRLVCLKLRQAWQGMKPSYPYRPRQAKKAVSLFVKNLPFKLTQSQTQAIAEILADLARDRVMNRIVVGDVGSGKTVVAAAAVVAAHASGWQAALMVPTEILARQHQQSLKRFLPSEIKIGLLTASISEGGREGLVKTGLVVGTHALLWDTGWINRLGLVIIDEQHRFGVSQRAGLQKKSQFPHLLTLTATPIPRTLNLTVLGHLDLSLMEETPTPKKLKTWVVPESKRAETYQWIEQKLKKDSQAFIICPLIEESESLKTIKAATQEWEKLTRVFSDVPTGLIHGRMGSEEKNIALEKFRAGSLKILVATPVVEVGIDIPNASIMIVEGAQRFGLAQLHQLRGRIGRAGQEAFCFLFPSIRSSLAIKRLKALENVESGSTLAELDLKLRGPGLIFGTEQHGWSDLRFANYFDVPLFHKAGLAVAELVEKSPHLLKYPQLRLEVERSLKKAVSPS